MLLLLFFSTTSIVLVIAFSLVLMLSLTFVYRSDRRQYRLFLVAWAIFGGLIVIGVFCILSGKQQAENRLRKTLDEITDHLVIAVQGKLADLPANVATNNPLYREGMDLLAAWQDDVASVGSIYTLRKGKYDNFVFVLCPSFDVNRDGRLSGRLEKDFPPGYLFTLKEKKVVTDLQRAFQGENRISITPYQDEWGKWITAFRPLRNAEGEVEAVFGVDFWGDDWKRTILIARAWPTLFFYSFLIYYFFQLFLLIKQRSEEKNLRYYSHEIGKMIDDTIRSQRQLRAADKNKKEFLKNMCDALAVPFREISRHVEELRTWSLRNEDAVLLQNEGVLQDIHEKCAALLATLDAIHIYSQINTERVTTRLKPIFLRDIFLMLEDTVSHRLKEKHDIAFHFEIDESIPSSIMIDDTRFLKILLELLDNAIQFTEKGSIFLHATIREPDATRGDSTLDSGELQSTTSLSGQFFPQGREEQSPVDDPPLFDQLPYLKITVSDTGCGIAKERLSTLFHPFVDGKTGRYGTETLKFGLCTARSLARIIGGKIRVTSTLHQGSAFSLLLPAIVPVSYRVDAGHDHQKEFHDTFSDAVRPLEGLRILIIDDNVANRIFIETILNDAGAQTEITDNGQKAIEILLEERHAGRFFDLIVMDAHLPQTNGFIMTREIRNRGFTRAVILTGSSLDTMSFSQLIGRNVLIQKPVDRLLLIQTVLRLTEGWRPAKRWNIHTPSLAHPF